MSKKQVQQALFRVHFAKRTNYCKVSNTRTATKETTRGRRGEDDNKSNNEGGKA